MDPLFLLRSAAHTTVQDSLTAEAEQVEYFCSCDDRLVRGQSCCQTLRFRPCIRLHSISVLVPA